MKPSALRRSMAPLIVAAARKLFLSICMILPSSQVLAQGAPTVEVIDSRLRCLVAPPSSGIEYDKDLLERKIGGIVRVRLTFYGPDRAPEATVFFQSAGERLEKTVLDWVAAYRLPCMGRGDPPVTATQEFRFEPQSLRVLWQPVRYESLSRGKFEQCLVGAESLPSYPHNALRKGEQGRVFAIYTFRDALSPPDVNIVYDGGMYEFARAVRAYAARYRLPCMVEADAPVVVYQPFHFQIEGEKRPVLKNSTLGAFLANVEKADLRGVKFDFTTMGCPFQLAFVLRRPYLPNAVGEVERHDANRTEFLEWLKNIRLDLPPKLLSDVLGDSMFIDVPCALVDLT